MTWHGLPALRTPALLHAPLGPATRGTRPSPRNRVSDLTQFAFRRVQGGEQLVRDVQTAERASDIGRSGGGEGDEDLEMFRSWLKSLKK